MRPPDSSARFVRHGTPRLTRRGGAPVRAFPVRDVPTLEPQDVLNFPHRENTADDREDSLPVSQPGNLKVTEDEDDFGTNDVLFQSITERDDDPDTDVVGSESSDWMTPKEEESQALGIGRSSSEDTTPQYVVDEEDDPNPHWI